MPKVDPMIFERGDKLYIVAPVSPFTPGDTEIEEYAFAEQLKKLAPNENLMWLRGQYVEADVPNRNGQQWQSGELAIKSLTPMLMPVTVMHDPRTAVGTIADAKLLTPEGDNVPRARIDTSLAIWKHRFPEVCEEAQVNYEQGTLMQSMECISPQYSCAECGELFQKLPQGAERKNWCAHLKEAAGLGARILGNVVFTGTGLIFGTEGATGAFDKAHLDIFQEEVAEFHDRSHRDKRQTQSRDRSRRKRRMDPIEISREEYAELQKRPTKDDLDAANKRADDAETAKAEAESKAEELEAGKTKAEGERDEAVKERDSLKENAEQAKLRDERMGKLGKDFKAKLGDFTADRLRADAAKLSDEDWTARLQEVSEMVGVKPDEGGEGDPENKGGGGEGGENASRNGGDPEFSREEVARSQAGSGSGGSGGSGGEGKEPSQAERSSVMRGLVPAKSK